MSFSPTITTCIKSAAAKALATTGPHGINVVPVSVISVTSDSIWLYDFFMDKTVANLTTDPAVALTCWSDLVGVQIKAIASYLTSGSEFAEATDWIKTEYPDRTLNGLIILSPTAVYDISPGGAFTPDDLSLDH